MNKEEAEIKYADKIRDKGIKTLIATSEGSIYTNCDTEELSLHLEEEKITYYILKNEQAE